MCEKFLAIGAEKQRAILQAALSEFAERGYHKANTNTICEKAGISKGLLFHYFGSKKALYLYLLDDVMKEMTRRLYEYVGREKTDLFDLITETSLAKMRVGAEMPEGYRLIYEAFLATPDELSEEMKRSFRNTYTEQRAQVLLLVDESKFKPTVSKERAVDLLLACTEGIFNRYYELYRHMTPEEALPHMDSIRQELIESLLLLKTAFYKEEYL